jgi:hypothetical protein
MTTRRHRSRALTTLGEAGILLVVLAVLAAALAAFLWVVISLVLLLGGAA